MFSLQRSGIFLPHRKIFNAAGKITLRGDKQISLEEIIFQQTYSKPTFCPCSRRRSRESLRWFGTVKRPRFIFVKNEVFVKKSLTGLRIRLRTGCLGQEYRITSTRLSSRGAESRSYFAEFDLFPVKKSIVTVNPVIILLTTIFSTLSAIFQPLEAWLCSNTFEIEYQAELFKL